MGKFWKEIVGGQVQQGVYLAGPRHASRQYGSFKSGRPPRLPFQFVTFFELNNTAQLARLPIFGKEKDEDGNRIETTPAFGGTAGLIGPNDAYTFSSLVRAIDMPSVDITVEKRNQYNKLKPVILTKNFKPFTMTVYDDIESRWFGLWQHYYNYHFMDGRRPYGSDHSSTEHDDVVANSKLGESNPFDSDRTGADIHNNAMRNYIKAIHVFQIHGEYVTRTSALNPVITSAESTQLDYASSGVPSEITFNIEYEKLEYGPKLNFRYKGKEASDAGLDNHLETLLEEYTKAPVFDPSQDKVRGLVQSFLGLEQTNLTQTENQLYNAGRDVRQPNKQAGALLRTGGETTQGGFFSNLLNNAIERKLDEATGDLFKKNNKNLNKLNFF